MTATQQMIVDNLQDLGGNNYSSLLKGVVGSLQRQTVLNFPAACWQQARDAGYSFADDLNSLKDSTYDFLQWLCIGFPGFGDNPDVYISQISFSSLWRPDTADPHEDGRGLDITQVSISIGDSIVFNNVNNDTAENAYAQYLRNACFPDTGTLQVSQYFTPWKMCTIDASGNRVVRDNDRTSDLDVEHLTHWHVTIFR